MPGVRHTASRAHAHDDLVSLLPMRRVRAHLVRGKARRAAGGRRIAMHCRRCGGALLTVTETLPYVGPGEYVVKLRDVGSLRCSACRARHLHVPDLRALDVLIQALAREQPRRTPQLAFRDGHWRVAAWSADEHLSPGEPT
jgi:hypothetical protein